MPIVDIVLTRSIKMPNFVADKVGPMNALIPCVFVTALLGFSWIGITSPAGVIVFCFLYGYGYFFNISHEGVVTN